MYADAQQELGAAAWVGMMRPSSNAGIRVFRRTVGRDRGVETWRTLSATRARRTRLSDGATPRVGGDRPDRQIRWRAARPQ